MIKLYSAFCTDLDSAAYGEVYKSLSAGSRIRVDRCKTEQARNNSLLGHYLLMQGTKEIFGRSDCDVVYTRNGKPILPFCKFSIAHTENLAVCAFSDTDIGIDAEMLRSVKTRESYPFFTRRECDFVNGNEELHDVRFMHIWTRKEAYVKMLGETMAGKGGADVLNGVCGAVFSEHDFDGFAITVCEAEKRSAEKR